MTRRHARPIRWAAARFGVCASAALAAQLWLQATYRQVEAPVALAVYGLETDAATLRGWYADLAERSRLLLLIRTEVVDLLWAVALAATLISLVHLVAGIGARQKPRLTEAMRRWAPLFALGPTFDLIENAFSLAMLTDPAGFPNWWAMAHGTASRLKFGFSALSAVIGLTLTAVVVWSARGGRNIAE